MREIKFRVWDLKHDHFEDLSDIIITFDGIGFEIYNYEGSVLDGYELNQYTGLKDKNGKEIYEGDILKFYNDVDYIVKPGYAEVIFEDGVFACKHFKYGIECLVNMDVVDMDITVAGNIYENPELLEGN